MQQECKVDTDEALEANLVVIKSSRTKSELQDESSKSWNDTDAVDADIRPIYNKEPMVEVVVSLAQRLIADVIRYDGSPKRGDSREKKRMINKGKKIVQQLLEVLPSHSISSFSSPSLDLAFEELPPSLPRTALMPLAIQVMRSGSLALILLRLIL
nr:hypothetical protein [Tanacetum cinerariifolium]